MTDTDPPTDGRALDLGALDAPVLFFGGPYSNRQATEAVFTEARKLGIPPERMICTGDVVAYAADPAPSVEALMEAGAPVVMGNCEESLGFDEDDCGCGFAEDSACDVLSKQWFEFARRRLTPDQKAWMRSLPRQVRLTIGNTSVAVIHGGTEDIARWLFRSSPASEKREEIERIETNGPVDLIVAGHSGLPFLDDLGDKLWLNAGVIGMPANNGTPRTWYAFVEPVETGGVTITIRPLEYDHEGAARRMGDEGLAEAYAKTLTDGLWPNIDVLPVVERAARAQALAPQRLAWSPEAAAAAE